MHSTPSLRSFPNVQPLKLKVPMLVWLTMALSRSLKEDQLSSWALPLFLRLSHPGDRGGGGGGGGCSERVPHPAPPGGRTFRVFGFGFQFSLATELRAPWVHETHVRCCALFCHSWPLPPPNCTQLYGLLCWDGVVATQSCPGLFWRDCTCRHVFCFGWD